MNLDQLLSAQSKATGTAAPAGGKAPAAPAPAAKGGGLDALLNAQAGYKPAAPAAPAKTTPINVTPQPSALQKAAPGLFAGTSKDLMSSLPSPFSTSMPGSTPAVTGNRPEKAPAPMDRLTMISKAAPETPVGKVLGAINAFAQHIGIVQSPGEQSARSADVASLTTSINDAPYYQLGLQLGLDSTVQPKYPAGVSAANFQVAGTDPYKYKAIVDAAKATFPELQKQHPEVKAPDQISADFVDTHFDDITKQMGIRTMPTNAEFTGMLLTGLIPEGIAAEIVVGGAKVLPTLAKAGLGLASYQALSTAEEKLIKIATGKEQGLAQAVGEQFNLTPQATALIDLLDMGAKGGALYGVYKAAPSIFDRFTKDTIHKVGLPEYTYVDGAKIKDLFQTGKLTSQDEKDLITSLGLSGEQYKGAFKNGLTVEIPSESLTRIVDKPYWAKIKGTFGFEPTDQTITANSSPAVSERIMNPAQQLPAPESPEGIRAELAKGKTPEQVTYELSGKMLTEDAKKAVAEALKGQEAPKPAEVAPEALAPQEPTPAPLEPKVGPEVLTETPGSLQDRLTGAVAHNQGEIAPLEARIAELEQKVVAAKPQSQEKKDAKQALADARAELKAVQTGHSTAAASNGASFREAITSHINDTLKSPLAPEHVEKVVNRVAEHITNPDLAGEHAGTSIGDIAARVHEEQLAEARKEAVGIPQHLASTAAKAQDAKNVTEFKQGLDESEKRAIMLSKFKTPAEFFKAANKTIAAVEKELRSQKEIVKEAVAKKGEAHIKEVAKETKILEPNIRRILGMGAKDGTFERVADGIYKVKTPDGKDIAVVIPADAIETLPKLAAEGFKSDMVFLDIPYKTRAVNGGSTNRGVKYEFISPKEFDVVLKAVSEIVKGDDSAVFYMYSQAASGAKEMQKYTDVFAEHGFKPVARGEWQKLFQNGKPVTNVRGNVAEPEGIILFNKSGNVPDVKLDFALVRPKGYQTEKPAAMLKALIEMSTKEGEVVLDPFAGSGVTAAEAAKAGRKSVSIEKNAEQAKKIVKRVGAATKEYPTIHQGGIVKQVQGEPVDIVPGVETFLHEGDKGWVVSEASTGRYLADSRTKAGAIAKAKVSIEQVGIKKFKDLIKAHKLPERGPSTMTDFMDALKAIQDGAENARELVTSAYWHYKIQPAINDGEAVIIGADDIKDAFKDYDVKHHPIFSGAAADIYTRALQEVSADTVKFTVGGTGSGKSDFLVPDMADQFSGIVYDSTGWNYDGMKKQIAEATAAGKKVEVYGIVPDLVRSRAYTFIREAAGGHPVTETAFARTHAAAIQTLLKLAKDGEAVHVLDTRNITTKAQVENATYAADPVAVLEPIVYNEANVTEQVQHVNAENAQEIVTGGQKSVRNVPQENRATQGVDASSIPEKVPREPKPKVEKPAAAEPTALDPKIVEAVRKSIEKTNPTGWRRGLNEIATLFNPTGQAPARGLDVLMEKKGEFERVLFRTERMFKVVKDMWDKQPERARLDFMSKVESGDTKGLPAELKPLADMYRLRLDNAHTAISEFKQINFLENFFPHFWKDPEAVAAADVWLKTNARRPLQGPKPFTKERVFATIQEGINAGFVPESTNPEELMQIYEQNVQKFLMANRIMADLKTIGLSKFVKVGGEMPKGFAKIDDAIARVYLNPNLPIVEMYDEQVYDKLNAVVQDLGLTHDRKYALGRGKAGVAGYTQRGTDKITTKFGSPLSVIAHELGHQLDYKYNLQQIFKSDPNRTYGSESDYTQKELRALADLRYEGHEVTASYKGYIRSAPEKMAVMLEAYVHAPEKFKEVAPRTFEKFTEFIKSHAELRPILDIKPSLVLGMREDTMYAGGAIMSGEHWVQKDVARLINNHLSKDHLRDTWWGQGVMNMKNTLNAFQLGLSAFHFSMETMDTIITKFSIGLTKVVHGDLKGFGDMLIAPVAPITYFRAGQRFYNGDPELLKIEKDLFTGGASLRTKQYYKNTVFDNFMKTNREIKGLLTGQHVKEGNVYTQTNRDIPLAVKKAAVNVLRLPLAGIEMTMRPLFAYYIPRLKVGAFRDLFASELERQSAKIQSGEKTQAQVAREVWNNIENRMGELNYDNLFWNRNFKASLMLTTRAVGWNLGTVRELGGGFFQDMPNAFKGAFKGEGFDFTPKMAYTLSLFFIVATAGAIYQYLHTGEGPGSIKDLFYPKNGATDKSGEPYRIEFPTYLKDIYQSGIPQLFSGDPFGAADSAVNMVKNKSAPELTLIFDLLNNKDFYGDLIRNPHDNASTQLKQVGVYLATQFAPFTIQQQQNLAKGKSTYEQQIEAFFGLIKAPKAVIQSEYQKIIANLYSDQAGGFAPRTPEQKAIDDAKANVVTQIKHGDYSGIQELLKQGIIKPTGVASFIQNALLTTPQKQYKYLTPQNKAKAKDLLK